MIIKRGVRENSVKTCEKLSMGGHEMIGMDPEKGVKGERGIMISKVLEKESVWVIQKGRRDDLHCVTFMKKKAKEPTEELGKPTEIIKHERAGKEVNGMKDVNVRERLSAKHRTRKSMKGSMKGTLDEGRTANDTLQRRLDVMTHKDSIERQHIRSEGDRKAMEVAEGEHQAKGDRMLIDQAFQRPDLLNGLPGYGRDVHYSQDTPRISQGG
ncbi:hypothetical protein V8B97DRAFT_2086669 [Scleroderma yunnanense]